MGTGGSQYSRPPVKKGQVSNRPMIQESSQNIRSLQPQYPSSPPPAPAVRQEVSKQVTTERTQRQLILQQPQTQEERWPLPKKESVITFRLTVIDFREYTLVDERIKSPPAPSEPAGGKPPKKPSNQRNTSDQHYEKKIDSKIADSAHVQSQLTAQFHACFNLTTYENFDAALGTLKNNCTEFDRRVKHKLAQLSASVEAKLTQIIDETKDEQDRLLAFDKARQTQQEELFQEWLQRYIVKLNEWRSLELAGLQEELLRHQKEIVAASERKTKFLLDEAKKIKIQILEYEQHLETQRTSSLFAKMYENSREGASQHLGSESKTELNLRIQANVGVMAPGQGCRNDPTP